MVVSQADLRNDGQKIRDEQMAAERLMPPPDLPAGIQPQPMERFLRKRPVAVMGVVENGLIRPLDPQVKLPEQSRVIIVTSEAV